MAERNPASRSHPLPEMCEVHVKRNLATIVLAYLLRDPHTGLALMNQIYHDSGVRLSPGRVYPLLRSLEKRGLIASRKVARQVVYRPVNRNHVEEHVRREMDACATMLDYYRKLARA